MHVTLNEPVERVAIIGCGGSGKTTVGRRIADALGTSITHLDAVYYDDEWNKLPQDKFAQLQHDLVAADRWVIDGNYAGTLPIRLHRATHVVFLDLPATTCLWGILQRRWRYRGGQHADGVYDTINWGFIKYVWGYRKSMAPRVRALLAEHGADARILIAKSRRQANRIADELERAAR
ncbi:topology modulation protein [Actinomadura sp. LCR2-06]|uniref:Topology modulation protein n=1 Tax=Actinomadura violacea TaxID=2819934 RepID=A0ABS3S9Y1_9ACTN|nr:topology modulation protein [Actinomadura violacea]